MIWFYLPKWSEVKQMIKLYVTQTGDSNKY